MAADADPTNPCRDETDEASRREPVGLADRFVFVILGLTILGVSEKNHVNQ